VNKSNFGKLVGGVLLGTALFGCGDNSNASRYKHNEEPVVITECRSPLTMECGFKRREDERLSEHGVKKLDGVIIMQEHVYPRRSGLDRFVFGDPLPVYTQAWLKTEEGEVIYLCTKRNNIASYDSTGGTITIMYRMPEELTRLDSTNFPK